MTRERWFNITANRLGAVSRSMIRHPPPTAVTRGLDPWVHRPLPTLPPRAGEGREGVANAMDTRGKARARQSIDQIDREPLRLPRIAVCGGAICDRTAVSPVKISVRLDIVAARPNSVQLSMSRRQYFSIPPARIKKGSDHNTCISRRRSECADHITITFMDGDMGASLDDALMAARWPRWKHQCQSQRRRE
jgi:hypothetical protein